MFLSQIEDAEICWAFMRPFCMPSGWLQRFPEIVQVNTIIGYRHEAEYNLGKVNVGNSGRFAGALQCALA